MQLASAQRPYGGGTVAGGSTITGANAQVCKPHCGVDSGAKRAQGVDGWNAHWSQG